MRLRTKSPALCVLVKRAGNKHMPDFFPPKADHTGHTCHQTHMLWKLLDLWVPVFLFGSTKLPLPTMNLYFLKVNLQNCIPSWNPSEKYMARLEWDRKREDWGCCGISPSFLSDVRTMICLADGYCTMVCCNMSISAIGICFRKFYVEKSTLLFIMGSKSLKCIWQDTLNLLYFCHLKKCSFCSITLTG